jgi:hypothetical protein
MNESAVMAPDWLQAPAPAEWYQRHGRRVENYHLPKTDAAREELARVVAALLPREQHEALQAARREQGTEEFRSRYAARAGIEGTHEQAIRRCGLRQCHFIGEAKAHLQHLLTAVAINLVRLSAWWAGTPLSRTRCSRFAALQPAA